MFLNICTFTFLFQTEMLPTCKSQDDRLSSLEYWEVSSLLNMHIHTHTGVVLKKKPIELGVIL